MKRPLLVLCCSLLLVSARAEELSVGDLVPDCALVDQAGKPFQLAQFRGTALAFTFIFTRCPLPDYCPRMTSHFAAVQQAMSKNANWHLLSLSFDPEHDTPEQLAAHARVHAADPRRWTFATGKPGVVAALGVPFGLTAVMKDGLLDHNLRTVVVDAAGRVQHIFKGNEWTPQDLVWEMQKAMLASP